ncbi:MAG: serine/threonine protein kinase [Betaproteobacteria bacterium]
MSSGNESDRSPAPYAGLDPGAVLDALESVGLRGDGRLIALNSYENRVYLVHLEDGGSVVAKFYRPGRWSDAQIDEEHVFAAELAADDIPAVAPLVLAGHMRHTHAGFRCSVYPRRGGRAPELDLAGVLEWIGRFIARIHVVGERRPFVHRPSIDATSLGREPRDALLRGRRIGPEIESAWRTAADHALASVEAAFDRVGPVQKLRLHGDCHPGNLLWTDTGPHFVDFDDARMGPAVQDLWMLLSGDRDERSVQLARILSGYRQVRDFDLRELALIEPLRTLRLIHYSAWIARRWDDPAFPAAFPWFGSPRYWEERVAELREQVESMAEPPIAPG